MKKLLLVLGDSTFMGKELIQDLSQNESYEVHYINRGKNYQNNAQYICLIKDTQNICSLFKQQQFNILIRNWEAVIIFSAFCSNQVKSVYAALNGLYNLYIFISTDSIYDVCKIKQIPITQEQDQRKKLTESQKKGEGQGHKKLKCEISIKLCN
ncbi:unnamed protein product [Paramecium pentaurelia]|uniref:Uncharacterized protein n=1 Tax=Paramecium pentaurelia TaxID=43138 RepID=A0A8S1S5U0_9CILI|nr:unnamed protein product [Paramecium pentaurelia]